MDEVVAKLIEVAARRTTVTYGEIAKMIDLDLDNPGERNRLAGILDTISSDEESAERPLLSVVVVKGDTGMPGGGFFTMARSQGLMKPGQDRLEFFVIELRRAHEYWAERGR
jgi:hypothetical protein